MTSITHYSNFNLYCSQHNFTIKECPKDGHCLVHAVIYAIYQNFDNYHQLLQLIANEFLNNTAEYIPFTSMNSEQLVEACQNYIFDREWDHRFTELVPLAISKISKQKIKVFKIINRNQFLEVDQTFDSNYTNQIYLRLNNAHYDSIIITNQPITPQLTFNFQTPPRNQTSIRSATPTKRTNDINTIDQQKNKKNKTSYNSNKTCRYCNAIGHDRYTHKECGMHHQYIQKKSMNQKIQPDNLKEQFIHNNAIFETISPIGEQLRPSVADSEQIKCLKKREAQIKAAEKKRQSRLDQTPEQKAKEAERKRKSRAQFQTLTPEQKERDAERKRLERAQFGQAEKEKEAERKRLERAQLGQAEKEKEAESKRLERAQFGQAEKEKEAERSRIERATHSPVQILNERIRDNIRRDNNRQQNLNEQIQKEKYLKEFNSVLNGDLHKQSWVKKEMKKFQAELSKLNQFHCPKCHEYWTTLKSKCLTCSSDKEFKISIQNDMIPLLDQLTSSIQKDFEDMTQIEEMLISPIVPMMSVYRLSGGQLVNSGYCASFAQDIQPICQILPKLAKEVSIIVIQKKIKKTSRVERLLRFLINNNPLWKNLGIKLSQQNLDSLPINGVPEGLNVVFENDDEKENPTDLGPQIDVSNEEEENEHNTYAYIEVDQQEAQQIDKIKAKINIPVSQTNDAINEFEQDGILTFPKLFPLGLADPTRKARLINVSETDAYRHLIKYACKDSKGDLYYPFAEHPRFLFYVSDRLRRHRTLDQSKVYLKQNTEDATLTITELKEIINSGDSGRIDGLLKRMSA